MLSGFPSAAWPVQDTVERCVAVSGPNRVKPRLGSLTAANSTALINEKKYDFEIFWGSLSYLVIGDIAARSWVEAKAAEALFFPAR
jgi:hypothetical protein